MGVVVHDVGPAIHGCRCKDIRFIYQALGTNRTPLANAIVGELQSVTCYPASFCDEKQKKISVKQSKDPFTLKIFPYYFFFQIEMTFYIINVI